jgi:Fe-S cluster assembly ATPase SufC
MQLCDLYLCPDGAVFLIDEFENSLGINCIGDIMQDILAQDRQLQFIVTSHHPYIINNIPPDYWKLITRNGGVVKTHSPADLGCDFTKSRHDTFMQLLQLDEFRTGQESEDEHLLSGRR